MDKKICIVTGANAGIGKEAVKQLAGEGYHVIMACRSRERGEEALNELKKADSSLSIEVMIVDMGLKQSVRKMADEFKKRFNHLDILIHNAAIFNVTQKQAEKTTEGIETLWATNHIGPVLLTSLLLESLKRADNGRIITISSKGLLAKPFLKVDLHNPEFKDRPFSVVNAYYQSKLAQEIYTYWLAEKLKDTAVTANCIRVTAVKVDVSRHPDLSPFMKWVYKQKAIKSITPEAMAVTYTFLAADDEVRGISGKYFDENNTQIKANKYSSDKKNIIPVMELTRTYVPELGDV